MGAYHLIGGLLPWGGKVQCGSMSDDIPATWDDLKPGVKVKVILGKHPLLGKTGYIVEADPTSTHLGIVIRWDDQAATFLSFWNNPKSFTVIQQQVDVPATLEPDVRSGQVDLSDWRVWRGKPEPGHCVCGCLQSLCPYHKEGS
jgi:hypothetical protein